MTTNHVLIDFENVQPKNLAALRDASKGHAFRIYVFVGANQSRIPKELAFEMQSLGPEAQYIEIAGSGKNAADFHIAFYLGALATPGSDDDFHIVSRDTGFDPLIRHLKSRNIKASRRKDLFEIPLLKESETESLGDKLDKVIHNFDLRGQSRPRKVKTLKSSIRSLFGDGLQDEELENLVEGLKQRKYVAVEGEKIRYRP